MFYLFFFLKNNIALNAQSRALRRCVFVQYTKIKKAIRKTQLLSSEWNCTKIQTTSLNVSLWRMCSQPGYCFLLELTPFSKRHYYIFSLLVFPFFSLRDKPFVCVLGLFSSFQASPLHPPAPLLATYPCCMSGINGCLYQITLTVLGTWILGILRLNTLSFIDEVFNQRAFVIVMQEEIY